MGYGVRAWAVYNGAPRARVLPRTLITQNHFTRTTKIYPMCSKLPLTMCRGPCYRLPYAVRGPVDCDAHRGQRKVLDTECSVVRSLVQPLEALGHIAGGSAIQCDAPLWLQVWSGLFGCAVRHPQRVVLPVSHGQKRNSVECAHAGGVQCAGVQCAHA